jgi:hypothetical protein
LRPRALAAMRTWRWSCAAVTDSTSPSACRSV